MIRFVNVLILAALLTMPGCSLDDPGGHTVETLIVDDWEISKVPYNFYVNPRDLFFVNSSVGFLVGLQGNFFKTPDAGLTWQSKNTGTTLPLFSVMFLNEQVGFVAGHGMTGCLDDDCNKGSILLKTTDGGENWTKTFFADYTRIQEVHFFDELNGLAIIHTASVPNTRNYHMSRTSDGGATWQFLDLPIKSEDKFQVVGNVVFVIGEEQKIFKSPDAGLTWGTLSTPILASNDVQRLYFADENVGFIDDSALIYKTTDGGLNWETLSAPFSAIGIIHTYDDDEAFNIEAEFKYEGGDMPVFKGTKIYRSSNSGVTWTTHTSSPTWYVPLVVFPESELGFGTNYAEFFTFRRR